MHANTLRLEFLVQKKWYLGIGLVYSSGELLYMSVYDFLLGLTSELDNNTWRY